MSAPERPVVNRVDPVLRAIVLAGLAWFFATALIVRAWIPSSATTSALRFFTVDSIETAQRYLAPYRTINVVAGALLALLAASLVLAPRAWRWLAVRHPVVIALVLWAIDVLFALPRFAFAWYRRNAWSLSTQPFADALGQWLLEQLLDGLVWVSVVLAIVLILKKAPRRAGSILGALSAAFVLAIQLVHPILIAPLFNTFEPIEQSRFAADAPRIRAFVAKAGVEVDDILVMDGSRQGAEGNAYVTGMFGSERVVLFDTILAYPPAEVDAILGHELGHWAHGDVWKGILASTAVAFLFPLLLVLLFRRNSHLPIVFVLHAVNTLGEPLTNPVWTAFSRVNEAAADAFSLELTDDAATFVDDERRLALEGFSDLALHPVRALQGSHPTTVARVARGCARSPDVCTRGLEPTEVTVPFAPAARDRLLARLGPDLTHPIGLSFAVVADADRLRTTVPARDASVARRLLERVIAHAR